jgi:thiol-disulfide isomerase/thioredoxin
VSRRTASSSDAVTWIIVALLLVGAIIMGFQEVSFSSLLKDGTVAPDFTLKTLAGPEVTLSKLRGKVVLVDFWATWCPPCRAEMPYLLSIAKEYEARGVTLVAVNRDDLEDQVPKVLEFAKEMPRIEPYTAFGTPELSQIYLVHALPTLYVLDTQGRIVTSEQGQASESQLRRWIERALEAK